MGTLKIFMIMKKLQMNQTVIKSFNEVDMPLNKP